MNITLKPISFRTYREGRTLVPVKIITPPDEPYIHTFFDVCPWSPSGRYVVCCKLPFEDREPTLQDNAVICIIDLQGETIEEVYETSGWALQTGAHQQWGPTDQYIYFNDVEDGHVITIEMDILNKHIRKLHGPLYQISPCGSYLLSPSLTLVNFVQKGYGVPADKHLMVFPPSGALGSRGLWRTDVQTGKSELLVSFADVVQAVPELRVSAEQWFFFHHTKFNAQNTRIMQVGMYLMLYPKPQWRRFIITCDIDGTNIKLAFTPEQWLLGGHHPDWHSDGEHITMNVKADGTHMQFCQFLYDGTEFEVLRPELDGGGHPSVTADGKFLITDAYVEEGLALKNDETPLRLAGLQSNLERQLCYIRTICDATLRVQARLARESSEEEPIMVNETYTLDDITHKQSATDTYRLDPHPAWNRDFTQVCFNGAPDGKRQILIADLQTLLSD